MSAPAGKAGFFTLYGDLYRSPCDNKLWTRSDLEGSSRSSGFGRRGVAGAGRLHYNWPLL